MSYPEPVLTRRYFQTDVKTGGASIFRDNFTGVFRMLRKGCPAYSRHDAVSDALQELREPVVVMLREKYK